MSDRIEPIDPKLRSLLDEEAAEPFITDAMRSRILAGVTGAIGGPGSSGGGSSDPSPGGSTPPIDPGTASLLAKPLGSALGMGVMSAIFAAGVAVGTQVAPSPAPPPAQVLTPVPSPIEDVAPIEPPPAIEPEVKAPAAPKTRSVKPRPKEVAKHDDVAQQSALAEEERVIERARIALARGYHDDALSALDDHARRFSNGALAADRDGLRALVLSRAGRHEEARAAAKKYLSEHPQGTLAPTLRTIAE